MDIAKNVNSCHFSQIKSPLFLYPKLCIIINMLINMEAIFPKQAAPKICLTAGLSMLQSEPTYARRYCQYIAITKRQFG